MKTVSKILLCWVLVLISSPAYAVTEGFAPGFDANGLSASTLGGSNFVLGSIVGRGRFHVSPNNPDTVNASEGRSNDHRELSEDSATSLYTDMTWMLGYNYYRSTGTNALGETASDDEHSIRVGFALDLADAFDVIASVTYQVIPDENYSQGLFDFDLGYYISMVKDKRGEKVAGDDAESYYLRKAKEQEEVHYPAKDQTPNLKVGFHFMFAQARKSPTSDDSPRTEGKGLAGDTLLNWAGSGPYVALQLNKVLSFKLSALIYYYDVSVDNFLIPNTTIGAFRPQEGLAIADLDDTTPLLLTYPFRSITASMTMQTGIKTALQVAAQQATYFGSIGGDATTSLGGILTQEIAAKIKLGGQIDFTVGGGGVNGTGTTGTTAGITGAYLF